MYPRGGGLESGFSLDQKFPDGESDKNDQTDSVPDHPCVAGLFLYLHKRTLSKTKSGGLVSGDLSPAGFFTRCLLLRHHLFGGFVARRAQLHE